MRERSRRSRRRRKRGKRRRSPRISEEFKWLILTLSLGPGDDGAASVCDARRLLLLFNESRDVSDDDDNDEAVLEQRLRLPVFG